MTAQFFNSETGATGRIHLTQEMFSLSLSLSLSRRSVRPLICEKSEDTSSEPGDGLRGPLAPPGAVINTVDTCAVKIKRAGCLCRPLMSSGRRPALQAEAGRRLSGFVDTPHDYGIQDVLLLLMITTRLFWIFY